MKVFVLIPTRNRKDLLIKCLDSLLKQSYSDIEIVVIDDGSTDGTGDILKKKKVTVLEGDGNLWWSGAMRMGVEYVLPKSKATDFVLIQNDDTYMEEDFLEKLVKQSQENNRIILGTPVIDSVSRKLIHDSHKIIHGSFRPVIIDSKEEIISADTLSGRGALIPIEVFHKIGNFSKIFPQYASDYDFFCRAKNHGFKLGVTTKTETISTNSRPNLSRRVKAQSKLTFRDFFQLYFSRRSSNNLWSSTLITLMYSPWKYKLYGVIRIYGVFIKTFFVNVLIYSFK
ncbi:MAG TPA: glycosyltransferase family 2 protein [Candidatus Dojkabacteria bacterium]|nr:glycosyltransferase family 2 protein [Candidatus Dojkabacteria bacterium]